VAGLQDCIVIVPHPSRAQTLQSFGMLNWRSIGDIAGPRGDVGHQSAIRITRHGFNRINAWRIPLVAEQLSAYNFRP
jgi:hypothetical protein